MLTYSVAPAPAGMRAATQVQSRSLALASLPQKYRHRVQPARKATLSVLPPELWGVSRLAAQLLARSLQAVPPFALVRCVP
jgi:hypothetical protein